MADYLAATSGLKVEKSVHVEADVDEPLMLDETRSILQLAERLVIIFATHGLFGGSHG